MAKKEELVVTAQSGNARPRTRTATWPRRVALPDGSISVVRDFTELQQLREAYNDYNK